MKVYLVLECRDYEGCTVVKACSSKAKANGFCAALEENKVAQSVSFKVQEQELIV